MKILGIALLALVAACSTGGRHAERGGVFGTYGAAGSDTSVVGTDFATVSRMWGPPKGVIGGPGENRTYLYPHTRSILGLGEQKCTTQVEVDPNNIVVKVTEGGKGC